MSHTTGLGSAPAPRRPTPYSQDSNAIIKTPSLNTLLRTEEGPRSAGSQSSPVDDARGKGCPRPSLRKVMSYGKEVGKSWKKTWEVEGLRG